MNNNNQKDQQQQQKSTIDTSTPQGRALADLQSASIANTNTNNSNSVSNTPTLNSALRQQPQVLPTAVSSGKRRASPSRQELEDGVLHCAEFAPRWLSDAVCDRCNRPKRLHTFEAVNLWVEKAKRHQSPSIRQTKDHWDAIAAAAANSKKPLWNPKKVTPKVLPDVNPLSCPEFAPCWGRDAFCLKCHGQRDAHTRTALELFEERRQRENALGHYACVKEWLTERPLPTSSFAERREHRVHAAAARCEGFMPNWNKNDYCAICFQPEAAHSLEKRLFHFPTLLKNHLSGIDINNNNYVIRGQRPGHLTNHHFANSAAARNWWLVTFPWRHLVVYLPLEDLFSLACSERWLCVELRPLLKSTLSLLVAAGVTAHHDLRNDAVRMASNLEACSGEVKGLLSSIIEGLFAPSAANDNSDYISSNKSSSSTATATVVKNNSNNNNSSDDANGSNLSVSNIESIMRSGTVGVKSAMLRKLSRMNISFAHILPRRKIVLEHLSFLEKGLMMNNNNNKSNKNNNDEKNSPVVITFENIHVENTVRELVRILRRVEQQQEVCRRSVKFLSQELMPL